ncbi:CHASE3 domain-containing protein [Aliivibrio finisterrensis]|uniref:CHASE3 domain-containing protein n=1 Tax=Aliivibrio finisterrensis TaxID=511998 RepID=UPI001F5D83E8|nr:CHASE3 domain-containing protein [Aliivibrio finisterrensis]
MLLLVSITRSILTFKLEAYYGDKKLEWVIHTHDVITNSEKLLSSLKDAETGQRGFLLTHNVSYLQPYYMGDSEALIKTSQLLVKAVRRRDDRYRLGGDEFLIIGQEIAQHSGVKRLSSKLQDQFTSPVIIGSEPMCISLSMGVAIYPEHGKHGEELIKYTDITMYEAKKEEGATCSEFTPSMLKRESD